MNPYRIFSQRVALSISTATYSTKSSFYDLFGIFRCYYRKLHTTLPEHEFQRTTERYVLPNYIITYYHIYTSLFAFYSSSTLQPFLQNSCFRLIGFTSNRNPPLSVCSDADKPQKTEAYSFSDFTTCTKAGKGYPFISFAHFVALPFIPASPLRSVDVS